MQEKRLSNLDKLYHVPVFALRDLLERRVPDRKFGRLRHDELVSDADKEQAITEADVEDVYENYRYGRRLSFYLYLLPDDLAELDINDLQGALDELTTGGHSTTTDEMAVADDYEEEKSPNEVILLDEEKINGIQEIRYRYLVERHFLNVDEQPDRILQTRYGFLWLDVNQGFLAILTRDERVNRLLARALSKRLQAIPLPVHLPRELIDKHFQIEKIKRVSHYDSTTGIRQSISGQGLWDKFEHEIISREQQYTRPSSLYDEKIAAGISSGLGITARKGKIYLTRTLPTSLVRAWGKKRLPGLVLDVKDMRKERPAALSRSTEAINRMRLPPTGKAAIISIIEGLLQVDRQGQTSAILSQSALAIYTALKGKYFELHLLISCDQCDQEAGLCVRCDASSPRLDGQDMVCDVCGELLSEDGRATLQCMNRHIASTSLEDALSITPNRYLLQRLVHIFAELGSTWSDQNDYFYIEGSFLHRLKRETVDMAQLSPAILQPVTNFYGPVTGPLHAGSGDIIVGEHKSEEDEVPGG